MMYALAESSSSSLESISLDSAHFANDFNEAALIEFVRACTKCVRFNVDYVSFGDDEVNLSDATLRALAESRGDRLKEIGIGGGDSSRANALTEQGLIALFDGCKRIEALTLRRIGSDAAEMHEALRHLDCSAMKRIDVSYSDHITGNALIDGVAKTARCLVKFICELHDDRSTEGAVTDEFLAALAESPASQTLEELSIYGQPLVTETGMMTVATRFPNLTIVEVDKTRRGECVTNAVLEALAQHVVHRLRFFTHEDQWRVTEAGLIALYGGCSKLKTLHVNDELCWTDAVIEAVAASECAGESLHSITFSKSTRVSPRSVLSLVSNCRNLVNFECCASDKKRSIFHVSADVIAKLAECRDLDCVDVPRRPELTEALTELKRKRPDVQVRLE